MSYESKSTGTNTICPSFLLIGVTKGGTTSLNNYLQQHPEICMAEPKEPGYLSAEYHDFLNIVSTRKDYNARFNKSSGNKILGDASPFYLHSPSVPREAAKINPKMKFVVVLRQPVERAYSHHNHLVNLGHLPNVPFVEYFNMVMGECSGRIPEPLQSFEFAVGKNAPIYHSFYAAALRMFFDVFPRERFLIRVYEEYQSRFEVLVREIHSFLEVSTETEMNIGTNHNVTSMPRSRLLFNTLRSNNSYKKALKFLLPNSLTRYAGNLIDKINRRPPPKLDLSLINKFTRYFHDDILETEELIDMDLSIWR